MAQKKLFKESMVAMGTFEPKDTVTFEFELKDEYTSKDIEYWYPDCGVCTKAMLVGNKIVGTVVVEKAHWEDYKKGKTPITKYIYIAVNDGRNQFIGEEGSMKRVVNKEKEMDTLNVTFVVEKK